MNHSIVIAEWIKDYIYLNIYNVKKTLGIYLQITMSDDDRDIDIESDVSRTSTIFHNLKSNLFV